MIDERQYLRTYVNNRGEQVVFSINDILVSRAENVRTPNYKASGRTSGYKHQDSAGSKYNICLIWMAHIKTIQIKQIFLYKGEVDTE